MRSAARISRTVDEYRDHQAAERRRHLAEFLALVRRARERGEEWVRWLDSGRPAYSEHEYAAIAAARRKRPARDT
jgi:hypothetical protein